jgi:hypothetical protein
MVYLFDDMLVCDCTGFRHAFVDVYVRECHGIGRLGDGMQPEKYK